MRTIKYIVIHCTATKEGVSFDADDINNWHLQRGWAGIGYHYVVKLDGTIEKGRPDWKVGAHVKGFNRNSIGIVYVGGLSKNFAPKDTRTIPQKRSLLALVKELKQRYPRAKVLGHREFSPDRNNNGVVEPFEFIKQCPSYDVSKEYANV